MRIVSSTHRKNCRLCPVKCSRLPASNYGVAMSVEPRCYFGEMDTHALMISDWTSCFRLDPSDEQTIRLSAIWSPILGDQVVGHVEDTLCSPIRDWLVE
jgi:hypothetical protein